MKNFALASTALVTLAAGSAHAAGLDRSNQSILAIFDEPKTTTFTIGHVMPDVTGQDLATATTYDVGASYTTYAFTYADQISEQLSYALIVDQPFGSDVFYNAPLASSALGGTKAQLSSDAISFMMKYQINENFSVYGGPRIQRAGGDIALGGQAYARGFAGIAGGEQLRAAIEAAGPAGAPLLAGLTAAATAAGTDLDTLLSGVALNDPSAAVATATINATPFAGAVTAAQNLATAINGPAGTFVTNGGYKVALEQDWGIGFSAGVAYEIPDIALRLAVTYNSEVEHKSPTTEAHPLLGANVGTTTFKSPESVNIDFQTGLNEKTLLTAGVRWSNWGDFDVIPTLLDSDLANISDGYRWNVGVARRFTDEFVGSVSLTYEKDAGDENGSPLGPNDGSIGLSIGGRYTSGNLNISGGINYTILGDANAGVGGTSVANFSGNSAVGVGFKLAYEF